MLPSTLLALAVTWVGFVSAVALPEAAPEAALDAVEDVAGVLEKRGCFSTGAKFGGEREQARDLARKVCKDHFSGNYKKGQVRKRCYNLRNNKHVKFELGFQGHNAGGTRYISASECYNGLSKEVNCGRGGSTTYGNWRYRADPNNNKC